MTTPEEIKAEYTSSLADLTFNSKPLINVLTMLAEENLPNAKVIVEAIEVHLAKVATDVKLPILYLIDCICKNVRSYSAIFAQNIVSTFCSVFKQVDEKTRAEMFKLRQTWNDIFPQKKLYAIDIQIRLLDPAWPVTAQPPSNSIHLNPKFLKPPTTNALTPPVSTEASQVIPAIPPDKETLIMQEKLIQKQRELLELQQKKLELEVLQTKVKLQEQLNIMPAASKSNILLKPEVAKQLVTTANIRAKTATTGSSVMDQRMQNTPAGNPPPRINPVNSALVSAVRPIRDPRLLRQQQKPASSVVGPTSGTRSPILENNKNVTNKLNVKRDPRLANKDSESDRSKAFPKSYTKPSPNIDTTNEPPKINKNALGKTDDSDKPGSSTKSSPTSSLNDSPKKILNDKPKSLPRFKRRDRAPGDDNKSKEPALKRDKPQKSDSSASFKNSKNSKNRNYIKHSTISTSPEGRPQDEDLRSLPLPEEPIRLQCDSTNNTVGIEAGNTEVKDVDLRLLPAVIGKKRSSTDSPEHLSAKKSKTEILDELFGNEDTDLRQLPVKPDRPPTPPPPIISSSEPPSTPESMDSPKKQSNLDAIRAKLANATSRDKIMSKSFHKKKLHGTSIEDQDLRAVSSSTDAHSSILISPDDEKKIKTGAMTKEQQTQLLNKIFMKIEKDKLREAKIKDEGSLGEPISDDDLDEYNPEDDITENIIPYNDKDERPRPRNVLPQEEMVPQFPPFYPRGRRGSNWRGVWRGRGVRMPRAAVRPWMQPPNWQNAPNVHGFQDYNENSMDDDITKSPDVNADQIQNVDLLKGEIRTINIDGIPRDIREYDDTAVVFLNWDDPREISFQDGTRRVVFNEKDAYYLSFNDVYKEVFIDGHPHKARLGAPSREIYIDGVGYECFFGSSGIVVNLHGANVSVKLDGPIPQVKIGDVKRTDLVVGKINVIIDAKIILPVFLDAKIQKFIVDGEISTLKFVDALNTVLINDQPFPVEYGGLPKPVTIHGKKHFIRFSVLPKGIRPGYVRIRNMEGDVKSSPRPEENSQDGFMHMVDPNEPALPVPERIKKQTARPDSPDNRSNSPSYLQNILQPNNLDVLSNVLSSSMSNAPALVTTGGYQVENVTSTSEAKDQPAVTHHAALPPPLNINDLFQKLVASGFVKTSSQPAPVESPKSPPAAKTKPDNKQNGQPASKLAKKSFAESLRNLNFLKPETLKVRHGLLYTTLYSGMQCSSCGMRFPPEASLHYSQHLDWHFRQNRKGKKNIRVASSRKWYYSLGDWKNYEEIEDLEEREKNYFDQQQQAEGAAEEAEEDVEVPSVPADPNRTDECCEVCRDRFDQFFNEEKEEWHLRNAVQVDGRTYHPVCYDDFLQHANDVTLNESKAEDAPEGEKPKIIPGLEIILDDEDDQDMAEAEIVSLDDDEPKLEAEKQPEEEENKPDNYEDEDDDVILNEVAPVRIVVDDDDDDTLEPAKESAEKPVNVKREKRIEDDGFVDVGGFVSISNIGQVQIKAEPMDTDELNTTVPAAETEGADEVIVEEVSDQTKKPAESTSDIPVTHHELVPSMDGNIELVSSVPGGSVSANRIKINISKPLPVIPSKEKDVISTSTSDPILEPLIDPSQPYPPGEEPEPDIVRRKPGLQNVELERMPPIKRGTELTGLCTIM